MSTGGSTSGGVTPGSSATSVADDPQSPSSRLLAALARIQKEEDTSEGRRDGLEGEPTTSTYNNNNNNSSSQLRQRPQPRTQTEDELYSDDSFSQLSSPSSMSMSMSGSMSGLSSPSARIQAQLQHQQSQLLAEQSRLARQQDQLAIAIRQNQQLKMATQATTTTQATTRTTQPTSINITQSNTSGHTPHAPDQPAKDTRSQPIAAASDAHPRSPSPPRSSSATSTPTSGGSTLTTPTSGTHQHHHRTPTVVAPANGTIAQYAARPAPSTNASAPPPQPIRNRSTSPKPARQPSSSPSAASSSPSSSVPHLVNRQVVAVESGINLSADHLKLLDLINRYTANVYRLSPNSSSWLKRLPLLVLVYEGIINKPEPIFTFDVAPTLVEHVPITGKEGLESRHGWMNIPHEAVTFLNDLQSCGLVGSLRSTVTGSTAPSEGNHSLAYQVTERGKELLRDLQVRGVAGIAQVLDSIDRLVTHKPTKARWSVTFDGALFHLTAGGTATRVSSITDVESLSFALAPFMPVTNLWHAKSASRFQTRGWSTNRLAEFQPFESKVDGTPIGIRTVMHQHARIFEPSFLTSEWIPMGENALSDLNTRLGASEKRSRRPLRLGITNDQPTPNTAHAPTMVLELPFGPDDTKLQVIDFDEYHYTALQVTSECDVMEGANPVARQLASFACSAHANGILSFGAHIDHVTGQSIGSISIDALTRVAATFQSRSTSVLHRMILASAQQRMLEALYGPPSVDSPQPATPPKPILVFCSSITPRAPVGSSANFYREYDVLDSELKAIVGPIQKCINLDSNGDEVLILGKNGAIVIGARARRHEETMHTWLNFHARSMVLEQAWVRLAQIGALIARTQATVDGLARSTDSSAQHLLPGLKHLVRTALETPLESLSQVLDYLRESVELLGNVSDSPDTIGGEDRATTKLRKTIALEAFARSLRRRCKDINTRTITNVNKELARLQASLAALEAAHKQLLSESVEHHAGALAPIKDATERHGSSLGVIQILLGIGLSIAILDRLTGDWSVITETYFDSLIGEPLASFTALDDVTFIIFNLLLFVAIIVALYRGVTRFIDSHRGPPQPYVLRVMKLNRKIINMAALESLLASKRATEDGWELVMNTTIRRVHWEESRNEKGKPATDDKLLSWSQFSHPPQRIEFNIDPRDEYLLHLVLTWSEIPPLSSTSSDGKKKSNEIECMKNHLLHRLVDLQVIAPEQVAQPIAITFAPTRTQNVSHTPNNTTKPIQTKPTNNNTNSTSTSSSKPTVTPNATAATTSIASKDAPPVKKDSPPQVAKNNAPAAMPPADKTPQKKEDTPAATVPAAAATATATPKPAQSPVVKIDPLLSAASSSSPSLTSPRLSGRTSLSLVVSAFSPSKKSGPPSPPPIYNENGVELLQPITINPRTGKPRVKKHWARRYASLILKHVAKQNAERATREALEYRAKKAELEKVESLKPPVETNSHRHSRKMSVRNYLHGLASGFLDLSSNPNTVDDAAEKRAREKEEALKAVLGEDPTQRFSGANAAKGDNSKQIEALHQAGNIFNAVVRADRKQVDALLRANPHVLSQRGPVGDLPLHMCFLYNTPAHHVLAFYLMQRCPHVIAEPYLGTEYTGENILHIAIIQQDLRMVELLVKKEPALLTARATGRFFSRGEACYYGEYPLYFACCTGQQQIAAFLIDSGADMNVVDSNGNNALHLMVHHSRPEMYTFVKRRWIEWNESRPEHERLVGNQALWKQRNADGFTPMTLTAKIGNLDMFSFLLEEEKQIQWSYGPMTCAVYPLEQIDMPLTLASTDKHGRKIVLDDDADDESQAEHPRALELIVNEAHLDLLMHPRMIELIKQKWERFASRIFFQRFMVILIYLILFTTTTIHRQTQNILGLEEWNNFEENLQIYKNQSQWIEHITQERAILMEELEAHATKRFEENQKAYQIQLLKATVKNHDLDSPITDVPFPPSLESIRIDLINNLSLPALPVYNHIDVDLSSLDAIIAKEKAKDSSRESAGIAKRRRSEEEEQQREQIDISHMSKEELQQLLTPPEMLYDDGILGGFVDLIAELSSRPPADWLGILCRYPCVLFLGELMVVGGALYKGNNEMGELRDRGIKSYFGAAGSAFFENTLSLVFSSLMLLAFILSMSGSYLVRMLMGLCSMVGWSYIFFFLLAFRMTGPMIVMIYQMLTSDVIRFLTVFGVFLGAFAQAFFVLFDHDGFGGFIESISTCFLAMLGDFVFDDYTNSPYMMISVGLLISYVVVVTILLLNLLIAMMGDTYGHINETAEMQWHLERARIIFAIEHEMGEEERGRIENKYWTVLHGKRYLQVMVENPQHFRKKKNQLEKKTNHQDREENQNQEQ